VVNSERPKAYRNILGYFIGTSVNGSIGTHCWDLLWFHGIRDHSTSPGLGQFPGSFFEDELNVFCGLSWFFWNGEVNSRQYRIWGVTRDDGVYDLEVSSSFCLGSSHGLKKLRGCFSTLDSLYLVFIRSSCICCGSLDGVEIRRRWQLRRRWGVRGFFCLSFWCCVF